MTPIMINGQQLIFAKPHMRDLVELSAAGVISIGLAVLEDKAGDDWPYMEMSPWGFKFLCRERRN